MGLFIYFVILNKKISTPTIAETEMFFGEAFFIIALQNTPAILL